MFKSRISAEATEHLPGGKNLTQKPWRGPPTRKDLLKSVWKDTTNWGSKKTKQLHKVSTPCLDDYQIKKEALEAVGESSKICPQIVLQFLCLARIGRPDILWSANELARSVTKRTQACDRRLARLISHIHHTSDYRQYCHVGNTSQHCRLSLLQDSDFAGDLEDSKSTSGGVLGILGNRTFVAVSWMCKKQTLASHSSTESEIMSLDAGLRMDGLLALDLWDVVVEVLRSTNGTKTPIHPVPGNWCETCNFSRKDTSKSKQKRNRGVDQFSHVDHVTPNAHSSQGESQLHIFEDNEAVIKMSIKGRSPTMRHVWRTHSGALDWLFDRINLDPQDPNQMCWHQEPTCRHSNQR